MRVLGIETSCDETAAALFDSEQGLLAHNLFSQVAIHREYGGVVPELASRDHVRKLLPLIERTLQQGASGAADIDGIAYTAGPGLAGALLVGASVGQSLARVWKIPALAIHHMEGHLLAPLMEPDPPEFPFIALLVSGGHTQLMQVAGIGDYRLLGESVDDAAGEAFDKTAKLLGLDYPGGPALARLAERGDERRFRFPRPMTNRPGLDFSFSGLKTFAANTLREFGGDPQTRADIASAFQEAVVDTLTIKCRRAVTETGLKRLVIAGGVGANKRLRQRLAGYAADAGVALHYPRPEFCTDNGAMIAFAGCQRLLHGDTGVRDITTRARWDLAGLRPPAAA